MGAQYVAAAVGCLELGPKPGRHSLCAELKLLSSQLPLINPQLTASLDCGGMRLLRLKDCTVARLSFLRVPPEPPPEHADTTSWSSAFRSCVWCKFRVLQPRNVPLVYPNPKSYVILKGQQPAPVHCTKMTKRLWRERRREKYTAITEEGLLLRLEPAAARRANTSLVQPGLNRSDIL